MARKVEFEDMDSNGMFGHLMDDAAEKMSWNRDTALRLLEMATAYEERAEKLRHLAATLVLEAQDMANETAEFLSLEFPMGEYKSEPENPDGAETDE
jgi:hypothetical protein